MMSSAQSRLWIYPLLSLLLATAPARGADVGNLLTGYSLTSWNEAEGRALGTVNAIAQHQDGYLWIGTDTGLFRFDGSRFAAWEDISDTPLPNSAVSSVCISRDGSLWVGFADGAGIRRVSNGQVRTVNDGIQTSGSVSDLVEDGAGTVWAVVDGALYSLSGDHWKKTTIPWRTTAGRVLQAYISHEGMLWIATRWGVFRHVNNTQTFVTEAAGFIWGISEDATGTFWTTDIAAGFRRLAAVAPRCKRRGRGPSASSRSKRQISGSPPSARLNRNAWRASGGCLIGLIFRRGSQ